ncbi:DUF5704 domain-containing protein [Paraburkholderia sp. RL17-368-BIF-A]
MFSKLTLKLFFLSLLFTCTFMVINSEVAFARGITIDGILMKDSVGRDNPEDEPQSYSAVEELIDHRPEERTGWSGILYTCNNNQPNENGDPWIETKAWNTADGSYIYYRSPEAYRDEIIQRFANTGIDGEQVYEQAVASGQMFQYDGNGMTSIYNKDTRAWPCNNGDEAYFYNNNDIYLTMDIEFDDIPPVEGGDGNGENGPACDVRTSVGKADDMESDSDDMKADPIGEINEDDGTASDIFDVMNYSIPTDEYLDVWGETERYLSDYQFQQYEGEIEYTIEVDKTYNLRWQVSYSCGSSENPKTCWRTEYDTDHITNTYKDAYDYSFWQIGHLVMYKLTNLEFENYALPSMHVTVINDEHETAVDAIHSDIWEDHVKVQPCSDVTLPSQSVNGGKSGKPSRSDYYDEDEFEEAAKLGSRIPDVKNDYVELETDGTELHMDDRLVKSHGPEPEEIPKADRVELDEDGYYIDAEKVNNYRTYSSITANYHRIININKSPSRTKSFTNDSDGRDINTVTVHTPVVMYSRSSDDKEHDQRINPPLRSTPANPDIDRHAYILDRPFTVWLPTNGQHLDYPGYGERDYLKYYKNKQVKFPFDVYSETKAAFYPANTWINVPPDMQQVTFFLPVWVPEGEYTVDYRAFAINYPGATYPYEVAEGGEQHEKNTTIPNSEYNVPPAGTQSAAHTVYDFIEVDVVGRLYDFHITDIMDYNWKNTFRNQDGLTPTGNSYWVGLNGIDGQFSLG